MDCPLSSSVEAYKRISTVASKIRSLCNEDDFRAPPVAVSELDSITIPPLFLPTPTIPSSINDAGCPPTVFASISDTFVRSALKFQAMFRLKHHNMAAFLLSDPNCGSSRLEHLNTFFQCQYREQLLALERSAVTRIQDLKRLTQAASAVKTKPVFNPVRTPIPVSKQLVNLPRHTGVCSAP